jgi:uncharacterized protein YabN with tetrapyrrole methylase and pyrophosphatase domain
VFGDVSVETADDVVTNWEQIKKAEKQHTSLVEGITPGLPALIHAQKLYRKATSIGLDPYPDPMAALRAAVDRLAAASDDDAEQVLGECLAITTVAARGRGLDAESALAGWVRRFTERFQEMEAAAAEAGVDLVAADPQVVAGLWADSEDRTHVR